MTVEEAARLGCELEIRNLISRIAILADQGSLEEYEDQFTEEAEWAFPGAPRRGRADIRTGAEARRADGITGPGTNTRHVITNVSVQVDDPDRATADAYFIFVRNTSDAPSIVNMGVYHDNFLRQEGTWRLARREISFG